MPNSTAALITTLEAYVKEQEGISGYWNGEDDRYIGPDGEVYDEEDAHLAQERMEAAQILLTNLKQYDA